MHVGSLTFPLEAHAYVTVQALDARSLYMQNAMGPRSDTAAARRSLASRATMLTRLRIAWLIAVLGIVAAPAAPALPQSSGDETELARPTPSWAAACTASGPRRWR